MGKQTNSGLKTFKHSLVSVCFKTWIVNGLRKYLDSATLLKGLFAALSHKYTETKYCW